MKPPTASSLSRAAHWRWDRGEYERAGELFLESAELARREAADPADGGKPDQSPDARVRAGLCLMKAGRVDRALPLLEEAIAFDWPAAGLGMDSHMVEHAFVYLLEAAAAREDVREFRTLWDRAVRRCEELGQTFTTIHPFRELLLDLCMRLGQRDLCQLLVVQIRRQRGPRLPKSIRPQVELAEAFLAAPQERTS